MSLQHSEGYKLMKPISQQKEMFLLKKLSFSLLLYLKLVLFTKNLGAAQYSFANP